MYFYLNSENQKIGPLLLDDLKKLPIDEKTYIYKENWTDWKIANEVDELKNLFQTKSKKWHIGNGQNTIGPLSIDEIIDRKVSRETLLWVEGTDKWIEAVKVLELKEYFATVPPPLPKKSVLETFFSGSDTVSNNQPKSKPETVKEQEPIKEQEISSQNESKKQAKNKTSNFIMDNITFFKQYKKPIIIGSLILVPVIIAFIFLSWRGSNTGDKQIAESAAKDFCSCIEKYDDMAFVGGQTAVFVCAASKPKIRKLYTRLGKLDAESSLINSIDLYIVKSNFTSALQSKCKDKGKEYVELIEEEAKSKAENE